MIILCRTTSMLIHSDPLLPSLIHHVYIQLAATNYMSFRKSSTFGEYAMVSFAIATFVAQA